MKILLMGNPNVGKSVVFNRLTGANVIAANYAGTTVEYTKGFMKFDGQLAEIIDVPGTYSLNPSCKAEKIAVEMLNDISAGDIVINVVESTNIERSLNLTLQLLKQKVPMIVALNFWDEIKHKGISIDENKLQQILGIPCVPVCAVTGQGIKQLTEMLPHAKPSSYEYNDDQRWHHLGDIVDKIQSITHRHHTWLEILGDASVKPLTGIPIAIAVMTLAFIIIRLFAENMITYVTDPIFENLWAPLVMRLSTFMGSEGIFHNILIGQLIDGKIDFVQSFGLLTTGLYIEFSAILPYIIAFYIILSFLEDLGFIPRLAVMVDTLMHRLGLHGVAIIPMLLGLGCNVPGIMATRILETRRERFIAATLLSIAVPCAAMQAMIVGLVGGLHGIRYLAVIYGTLFIVWIILGFIFKKFVKGHSPEIFMEIPPYRIPYMRSLGKKIWIRITWFLKEAVPFVLLGVLIANLLYTFGIIDFIGTLAQPVITGLLGLPKESAGALVAGFLRKDVAVGMLIPLGLTAKQLVIASVVLAMYFPCIATFTVLTKELGLKDMLKSAAIMVITSLSVGALLNLILP